MQMDEHLLLKILDSSHFGIVAFKPDHKVCFINSLAESIIGIKKERVLGKNLLSFPQHSDRFLIRSSRIPVNKILIKDKYNREIMVNGHIKPIIAHGKEEGYCLYLIKSENGESRKRTFESIRTLILSSLMHKRKTINQIAKDINVNWKTVENHLTYLVGKKRIAEIFSSNYVRIFEITEHGKRVLTERIPKMDVVKEIEEIEEKELSEEVEQ